MTSVALGVLWAALIVGILVPVSSLLAVASLRLARSMGRAPGADSVFLLIVLPTLAPVIWFVSETLHASESYLVGNAEALCYDLLVGSGLLLALLVASVGAAIRAELSRGGELDVDTTARIANLCETSDALSGCSARIVALRGAEHDSATRGLLAARIELDAEFVHRLDDRALLAVLLHEVEHLRRRDPLRNLLGTLSLAINPLRRLMLPEWARWRAERELQCDAAALSANADPLSLAEAILMAARPRRHSFLAAPLTGAQQGFVNLRIQRLLEPVAERRESVLMTLLPLVLLIGELVLPHVLSSAPIQQIHSIAFHPLISTFLG